MFRVRLYLKLDSSLKKIIFVTFYDESKAKGAASFDSRLYRALLSIFWNFERLDPGFGRRKTDITRLQAGLKVEFF